MYVWCVEDLHHVKADQSKITGFHAQEDFVEQLISQLDKNFLECEDGIFSRVKVLDIVAATRYLMKQAADSAHEISVGKEETSAYATKFLRSVCNLLGICNIPQANRYFVKQLCRRFGFSDYQQFLTGTVHFSVLVPSVINPLSPDLCSLKNCLFVLGVDYIKTLSRLLTVESEDNFAGCISKLSLKSSVCNDVAVQIIYAVLCWMNSAISAEGKALRAAFFEELREAIRKLSFASTNLLAYFADSNDRNFLELNMTSHRAHILRKFVDVVGSTLAAASHTMLVDLYNIITESYSLPTCFLPTMPQSSYFDHEVQNALQNMKEPYGKPPKAHLCPNGHVYFIGDCTKPEEVGTCPACQQTIGGTRGKLQPGNVPNT